MEATIDGLLEYARVGRPDGSREPVAIAQLLADAIDAIDPPPTFTIAIDPNLPTLNTSRLLLFQVLTNLIGNAVKHHDRSDGSIHIFGRDLGDVYELAIADDGPGIAHEYHDLIFALFQAINPQNRSASTGIGLHPTAHHPGQAVAVAAERTGNHFELGVPGLIGVDEVAARCHGLG